jgi:hypothetical protein
MVVDGNPLGQLSEGGVAQALPQSRLAHQDYLQERFFLGLQVGQQPQFLQGSGGQILGLIHHQDDVFAPRMRRQEELIKRPETGRPTATKMPPNSFLSG